MEKSVRKTTECQNAIKNQNNYQIMKVSIKRLIRRQLRFLKYLNLFFFHLFNLYLIFYLLNIF